VRDQRSSELSVTRVFRKLFRTGSSPVIIKCQRYSSILIYNGNLLSTRLNSYNLLQHLKYIFAKCSIVLQLANWILFCHHFHLHQPRCKQLYVMISYIACSDLFIILLSILCCLLDEWKMNILWSTCILFVSSHAPEQLSITDSGNILSFDEVSGSHAVTKTHLRLVRRKSGPPRSEARQKPDLARAPYHSFASVVAWSTAWRLPVCPAILSDFRILVTYGVRNKPVQH
jgi:hypothetical protein